MNTLCKVMVIVLVVIGIWIALATLGHCHDEGVLAPLREEPCHPGRHKCITDTECEEEEQRFIEQDHTKWLRIEKILNQLNHDFPIQFKESN